MTIIKEYVESFEIRKDGQVLSYRLSMADAKECLEKHYPGASIHKRPVKLFIVRAFDSNNKFSHINALFQEIKKDFPGVHAHDVEVLYYSTIGIRRTFGLEFLSSADPPEGFTLVHRYLERF